MRAYHGTNKVFSSFDLNFLLSGEGNNNHGEGFYFALRYEISEQYAKAISKRYLYDESGYRIDTYREPVFDCFVDNELDEYVIYTIKKIRDSRDYPYKQVILDILTYNKSRLPFNMVIRRYEEVVNTFKHKPPVVYTVDIDTSNKNKDKYEEYFGQVDGPCIIVKDPSIIKIQDMKII